MGTIIGYGLLKGVSSEVMLVALFSLITVYKFAEWQYYRQRAHQKLTIESYFQLRYSAIGIMYIALFGMYLFVGSAVFRFQPTADVDIQTVNSIIHNPSVSVDKKELRHIKREHYYDKVMMKWQAALNKDVNGLSKTAMILLGILGIILAVLSVPLACGLACNKQEALAVIILLLGVGCLVGAIILFIRAARKGKLERSQRKGSTSSV